MSQNQAGSRSDSASPYRNTVAMGSQVFFTEASVPGSGALAFSLGENSKMFVIKNTSDAFIQTDKALFPLSDPAHSIHIYFTGVMSPCFLGDCGSTRPHF